MNVVLTLSQTYIQTIFFHMTHSTVEGTNMILLKIFIYLMIFHRIDKPSDESLEKGRNRSWHLTLTLTLSTRVDICSTNPFSTVNKMYIVAARKFVLDACLVIS